MPMIRTTPKAPLPFRRPDVYERHIEKAKNMIIGPQAPVKRAAWREVDPNEPEIPGTLYVLGKRRGRPPSDTSKVRIGIRLDRDVLDIFRATGPGWQTVINDALKAVAFPAK